MTIDACEHSEPLLRFLESTFLPKVIERATGKRCGGHMAYKNNCDQPPVMQLQDNNRLSTPRPLLRALDPLHQTGLAR